MPLVYPYGFLTLSSSSAYQIARSLRFNLADSAYLTRAFGAPTDNKKIVVSFWFKRSSLGVEQHFLNAYPGAGGESSIYLNATDQMACYTSNGGAGGVFSSATLRDVSAWHHFCFMMDTTQNTSTNRILAWLNGVSLSNAALSFPSLNNTTSEFLDNQTNEIGRQMYGTQKPFGGYMAEMHVIDGTSFFTDVNGTLSSTFNINTFGEFSSATGAWNPITYAGTYGTNGFKLNFSDNSNTTAATLGADTSGNGNNWTPTNFSVTAGVGNDSLTDTPTNYGTDTGVGGVVRGNYFTLGPLTPSSLSSQGMATLLNGNLDITGNTSARAFRSSSPIDQYGKVYFELTFPTTASGYPRLGFVKNTYAGLNIWAAGEELGTDNVSYRASGELLKNDSTLATYTAIAAGDTFCVAYDSATGYLWLGRIPTSSTSRTWFNSGDPAAGTGYVTTLSTADTWWLCGGLITSSSLVANFGQRAYISAAPSGYKALCTQNMATPAIPKPSLYFDIDTYAGTAATRTKTGIGFQPDLVWFKSRGRALDHAIYDSVRGVEKQLESNSTGTETTETTGLTAFTSDGYTTGALDQLNGTTSTNSFVAWLWKSGGAAVSDTSGTITASRSTNATAGISIIGYTGDGSGGTSTIGHGLGVMPEFLIGKKRDVATQNWYVASYWSGQTTNYAYHLFLNTTGALSGSNDPYFFGSISGTSNIFLPTDNNVSGTKYIVYAFAPIAGFSKFGSYTGNGAASDGPFVWCGFRPRFVLIKSTASTVNWHIFDTSMNTYNLSGNKLIPNTTSAEVAANTNDIDILSNGFKVRGNGGVVNTVENYIFAAFAESPFKTARAR